MVALRSIAVAVLAGSLCAQEEDLAASLARVVDVPDPGDRAAAVRTLAKESDASVDAWREAILAFHPMSSQEPGVRVERAELWNGEALETTELWVRVPKDYDAATPHPLILQGHGTGGSGREQPHLWAAVADELGAVVVAPSESGANEGYRFSDRERQITLSAIRWGKRTFHVDEDRVFLSGISRGGHLTWDVALRFPDRFAAIAPMIGAPRLNPSDGQNNLRYLENVAHLPIRDLQGLQDDPRMIANLKMAFARLEKLGARDAELVEFPELGHSFRLDAVDWKAFLGAARRDARPQHVVRLAAREGETRAFWTEITRFDTRKVEETFRLRVQAAEWDALDEAGRREKMQNEADARTARLEATLDEPGRITVRTDGVKAFRLLLDAGMLDADGKVVVRWNGKTKRFTRREDAAVLLADFADRLDRRFLPIASVEIR